MMKTILITGGTGFVGANLVRRLIRDGHDVHLLVRPEYRSWRIDDIRKDVRVHTVQLADAEALTSLVTTIRPEWIFHLAVYGAYSYQHDVQQIVNTNILGTVNLVEACLRKGFEAFINTGSSSEYGFKDHAPTETEWLDPNSYYAVSKSSTTLFCRYSAKTHDAHIPTLRLFSVYGPYEEPTRLMPTLILKGLHNELPSLVDPEIARDLVYVDDVIDAYLMAAAAQTVARGSVYNVGTGVQATLQEIVTVARKVLKIEQKPEWGSMPNRQWDTTVWLSDNRKIRRELGWHPHYTFEKGFRTMVDWFQQTAGILAFYCSHRL